MKCYSTVYRTGTLHWQLSEWCAGQLLKETRDVAELCSGTNLLEASWVKYIELAEFHHCSTWNL